MNTRDVTIWLVERRYMYFYLYKRKTIRAIPSKTIKETFRVYKFEYYTTDFLRSAKLSKDEFTSI